MHDLPFFIAFLIPALFIFVIFRFGLHFFREFNNRGRLSESERWKIHDRIGRASPPSAKPRSSENRIFRVAYKHRGRLTVSDIVLETDLGIKEAEELINSMVDGRHVCMEVTDKGLVVYEFPEIISRFESQ